MVPLTGLGPVQYRYRGILSPLCLPFHHSGIPLSILSYEKGGVKEKAAASGRMEKTLCVCQWRALERHKCTRYTKNEPSEVKNGENKGVKPLKCKTAHRVIAKMCFTCGQMNAKWSALADSGGKRMVAQEFM